MEKKSQCKRRGKVWVALAVVTILGTVAAVAASSSGFGSCHGHRDFELVKKLVMWRVDDALDDLDATSEQRGELTKIAGEILADAEQIKQLHGRHEGTTLADFQKGDPNPDKLHQSVEGHFLEANRFAHRTLDRLLKAYAMLNPDQQQEVLDMWEDHIEDN